MTDYKALSEEISIFVKSHVKNSRVAHSIRVAECAVMLCRKFGLDEDKGWFLGMAHDMCKYFEADELLSLAEKDGMPIYDMERDKPVLLHGRAAAVYLKEHYDVDDPDLLEAIAVHVSGAVGMSDYAKVLYVADKTEAGRDHLPAGYREKLYAMPLDAMMLKVLNDNYEYIVSQGFVVYPGTEKLINELKAGSAE